MFSTWEIVQSFTFSLQHLIPHGEYASLFISILVFIYWKVNVNNKINILKKYKCKRKSLFFLFSFLYTKIIILYNFFYIIIRRLYCLRLALFEWSLISFVIKSLFSLFVWLTKTFTLNRKKLTILSAFKLYNRDKYLS